MQYRKFGKLDWKVSALGFGAMRLPIIDNDMSRIDESLAIQMLRYAIDNGVNYIDTAYTYHVGNSERVVGKALRDGYRQRTKLATKLSSHGLRPSQEFDDYFDKQLNRLQTEKIDFYLLHGLNQTNWANLLERDVLKWAESRMAKGQIGYLGFSFHDEYEVFKKIVDYYDNWAFCQVQYNYLDFEKQAGRRGVEYAANKGLGIVVMEPLRGGLLAKDPPESVAKVWANNNGKRSRVERALQWVWNQPEISVALSGMSTMEQVIQNVTFAGRSGIGLLSSEDLALYTEVYEAYQDLAPIPCTNCQYCQPCPNGVDIPTILRLYNEATIYEDPRIGWFGYVGPGGVKEEQRADKCRECGDCINVCPQQLQIPDLLKIANEKLNPKEPFGPPPLPPE